MRQSDVGVLGCRNCVELGRQSLEIGIFRKAMLGVRETALPFGLQVDLGRAHRRVFRNKVVRTSVQAFSDCWCVIVTGTHDNDTVRGWFDKASDEEKNLLAHFCEYNADTVAWKLIEISMRSNAIWAVTPLQDLLGLDGSARMNLPGTIVDNWIWQLDEFAPDEKLTEAFKKLCEESQRTQ